MITCNVLDLDTDEEYGSLEMIAVPSPKDLLRLNLDQSPTDLLYEVVTVEHLCRAKETPRIIVHARKRREGIE